VLNEREFTNTLTEENMSTIEAELVDGTNTQLSVMDNHDHTALRLGDYALTSYEAVLDKAAAIAGPLKRIISEQKLSKKIGSKEFVFVEGWTTCGAMMGVSVRTVSCEENASVTGEFNAVVEAVRSDGFVLGRGFASCGVDEAEWKGRSRQARKSMAQTRAAGKAMRLLFSWIMNMAGYAETPFEEMEGSGAEQFQNPANDRTAPKAAPRAERQESKGSFRKEQIVALWKEYWRKCPGEEPQARENFRLWASGINKGEFNVFVAANWSDDTYEKCMADLSAFDEPNTNSEIPF
jgi:hypothetical protein